MNKPILIKVALFVCLLTLNVEKIEAKLSQPDYVLYGTATWFGGPLATESEISIYLENQLLTVTKYSMGTVDALNGLYALRVPMDSLDPRSYGKARPGDPASIYINGYKVADVLVGDYGIAERLDIDPMNLSGDLSVININNASLQEGDSGESMMVFDLVLSSASQDIVTVDWVTLEDGSIAPALSGENCLFDVDYLQSEGTAEIPAGETVTTISVPICGDTQIEASETFEVVLSNSQNGVIQFNRAVGTILDDDGQPQLRGYDQVIFEPETGALSHDFNVRLSRIYEQDVQVTYTTTGDSATPGLDFVSISGVLTIPAGQQTAVIPVDILSDAEIEEIEILTVNLSNPVNASLVNNPMTGFIMDADKDDQIKPDNDRVISADDIPALTKPIDVVFSPDQEDVYVGTQYQQGQLIHFGFNNGYLPLKQIINDQEVGFETVLLDKIRDVKMSQDGANIYVAASSDNAINVFARDLQNGQLSLVQVVQNLNPVEYGIEDVYALSLSPDGLFVYAVGGNSDSVSVFNVNPTDGSLTYVEHETNNLDDVSDSGPPVTFMDRPIDVKVSPDGQAVYVAADYTSALVVFERDEVTGELSYIESFRSGTEGVRSIGGAAALWVPDSGAHVYVVGRAENSIARFNTIQSNQLSYVDAVNQVNADFIGLEAPTAIIGMDDGSRVYALGFDDASFVSFERHQSGVLRFADIEQDNVDGIEQLAGPIGMDMSPDNQWILVAAAIDNAINVFRTHRNDLIYFDGFDN